MMYDILVITKEGIIKNTDIFYLKNKNINFLNWYCPIKNWVVLASHSGLLKSGICGEVILATPDNPWWNFDSLKMIEHDNKCSFKRNSCYCSADLKVPKAIDQETYNKLLKIDVNGFYNEVNEHDEIIGIINYKYLIRSRFELHIDIGKKCNFDCSYCPPYVHDNFSPFINIEQVKQLVNLFDELCKIHIDKTCILTGGEPMLHKEIEKIFDYLKIKKYIINVNTNGTLNESKLIEYINHYNVKFIISIHAEFTTKKHLIKFKNLIEKYPNNILIKYMGTNADSFYFQNLKNSFTSQQIVISPLFDKTTDKRILIRK